jgi:hypothetical protein
MDRLKSRGNSELTPVALRAPSVSSYHLYVTYRKYFLIVNKAGKVQRGFQVQGLRGEQRVASNPLDKF